MRYHREQNTKAEICKLTLNSLLIYFSLILGYKSVGFIVNLLEKL